MKIVSINDNWEVNIYEDSEMDGDICGMCDCPVKIVTFKHEERLKSCSDCPANNKNNVKLTHKESVAFWSSVSINDNIETNDFIAT